MEHKPLWPGFLILAVIIGIIFLIFRQIPEDEYEKLIAQDNIVNEKMGYAMVRCDGDNDRRLGCQFWYLKKEISAQEEKITDLTNLLPLKDRCRLLEKWGKIKLEFYNDKEGKGGWYVIQDGDYRQDCLPYLEKVEAHYKIP